MKRMVHDTFNGQGQPAARDMFAEHDTARFAWDMWFFSGQQFIPPAHP